jgi:hypothetical protein
MTVIVAQGVRRCQAPFDSRHRPGRQIASLQDCRDLRRYLAPGRYTASSAQAGLVAQAVELAHAASRRLT